MTTEMYVVTKCNLNDNGEPACAAIAYSQNLNVISDYAEQVAVNLTYKKSWNYKIDGDPFYDPDNELGIERPDGVYLEWADVNESYFADLSIATEHYQNKVIFCINIMSGDKVIGRLMVSSILNAPGKFNIEYSAAAEEVEQLARIGNVIMPKNK